MCGGLAAHSPWPVGWHSQGAQVVEEQVDARKEEKINEKLSQCLLHRHEHLVLHAPAFPFCEFCHLGWKTPGKIVSELNINGILPPFFASFK